MHGCGVCGQVALAHSVDIIIGFHGAGMSHMFHMNPERSRCVTEDYWFQATLTAARDSWLIHLHCWNRYRCCGTVEIFPQTKGCGDWNFYVCGYAKRQGNANQARYLGQQYAPFVVRTQWLTFPQMISNGRAIIFLYLHSDSFLFVLLGAVPNHIDSCEHYTRIAIWSIIQNAS